jgi:hypothetical protein
VTTVSAAFISTTASTGAAAIAIASSIALYHIGYTVLAISNAELVDVALLLCC